MYKDFGQEKLHLGLLHAEYSIHSKKWRSLHNRTSEKFYSCSPWIEVQYIDVLLYANDWTCSQTRIPHFTCPLGGHLLSGCFLRPAAASVHSLNVYTLRRKRTSVLSSWRWLFFGIGTSSQLAQCHLGSVFFGLFYAGAVVPEPSRVLHAVDYSDSRPCGTAAYKCISNQSIRLWIKGRGVPLRSETSWYMISPRFFTWQCSVNTVNIAGSV